MTTVTLVKSGSASSLCCNNGAYKKNKLRERVIHVLQFQTEKINVRLDVGILI